MFEKKGILFFEHEDARKMIEGYYHLYCFSDFSDVNIRKTLEYRGIIVYKNYTDTYEFLIPGSDISIEWKKYIQIPRGERKYYLVGPILAPMTEKQYFNL